MKLKPPAILLSILIAASGVSCGGNNAPAEKSSARQELLPAVSPADAAPASDMPAIPKDARWTVFCTALGGPNHTGRAREMRARLINMTGQRDFYIVPGAEQTTIYYGFYKVIDDKQDRREAERAQNDRKRIANLVDPATGARMFRAVLLVNLEEPDPSAPTEWDLARAKGYWSLQIGVYKDSPDRKAMAVDAVREARAQGLDAYYYHGPTVSSICIGAWPKEAAERESERRDRMNRQRIAAGQQPERELRDPNAVRMVLPHSLNVPAGATTVDGYPIEVVKDSLLIHDQTLETAIRKFPVQGFNGYEKRKLKNVQTGAVREVVIPSSLVKIPSAEEQRTLTADSQPPVTPVLPPDTGAARQQPAPPANPWTTTNKRTAPQGGRLKGLED